MFFPYVIFLNSASSAAALVFYLPGVCKHTDTEGKQSSEKIEKNTIFNEHPAYNIKQKNTVLIFSSMFQLNAKLKRICRKLTSKNVGIYMLGLLE